MFFGVDFCIFVPDVLNVFFGASPIQFSSKKKDILMPNGYVSQIQINGGDVQNIGSCAYAVCDTAEDVSVKVVTLPGFVLKDGATIHIKFTYRNIAFNPKLNVNGTGDKTILLNTNSGFDSSLNLSSQYNVDQLWMAGAVVTLTYDGTYWVVNNPSRITSPYTYNLSVGNTIEPGSYMILADIEWELCNGASSATARVFSFKVCMSTMVDGLYRDRSAIMEVFVGGGYNKKDYADIMIHDESEYHVNNDYVFDSLVDSIFIYFEYEVSSGNVISKRTGHLLGKVPSRWSSFQLVPLTNMSVSSANPDEDHHFLKLDIAHSASSFVPSETSQTSIPSGNVLPTTVGVHRYLIKARMKPFDVGQMSGVLPIEKGGTGATTTKSARTNLLSDATVATDDVVDNHTFVFRYQTPSSDNGTIYYRTASRVWNWIKAKCNSLYVAWNDFNLTLYPNLLPMTSNRLYDLQFDDYFYGAMSRFSITGKIVDSNNQVIEEISSENLNYIFIPSENTLITSNLTEGNTLVINMNPKEGSTNLFNVYGKFYLIFQYQKFPVGTCKVKLQKTDDTWVEFEFSQMVHKGSTVTLGYVTDRIGDFTIKSLELRINGGLNSYNNNPSLMQFILLSYRNAGKGKLTKHEFNQRFYGNIESRKFIKTNGTSSQLMAANGDSVALPLAISKGGTGVTTALAAEYNLITKPRTTELTTVIDDDKRIPFCNQNPSTSIGTFAGYRKASAFWTYIQGKISSVLGLTSTNYGGTSAKATSDANGNVITTTYATLTDLAEKRDKYRLTSSWIGQNVAGTTYGVACRFKLTSVSEARSIFMRINAREVIHNLRISASSSSLGIADLQISSYSSDNAVYGYLDTATGIVTIYLYMRDYREGASVTDFSPANYYYYNSRLTDIEFPNREYVSTLPTGYTTAVQGGWARYDKDGNDISTYYQPVITAGTGLSKSGNTINHSNSVTAQTSGLGSSVRIPAIKYDAQGHITYGTYYSVFSHEQYSAVKCGYISNGTNGAGWYKIADITYWDVAYVRYDVIISIVGTGANAHDVGLLRIRGINAATAGVITGVNMGWIYKTPGTSDGFATNCIRATKTETNSSSGATLSLFIYIPTNNVSYNFLVLNEGLGGASIRGHKLVFANSTTKQTTEPAPTYTTNFLPLEIGNQSNCLEITDSNWQSYLTASNAGGAVPSNIANGDILTIPEGVSQVFFNTTNEASIALVRGASTLNRFPRNGVRITIAGNWKPQENGGYSGGNAVGRFSAYLYVYRGGVASSSANYRMTHAFEDFMYFNGVWYSKGY